MKMKKRESAGHSARLRSATRKQGLLCATMLVIGSGCSGDVSSRAADDSDAEPLGELTQHFDPSPSTAAKKGHVLITLKAIQLLQARDMLPDQLKSPENQALVVYGNNFGDNTGVGWPKPSTAGNLPTVPVKNHMTSLIPRNGVAAFASTADSFQFDAANSKWDDPTVTTTGRATIAWIPGKIDLLHDPEGNHISDSMRLTGSTTIDTDVFWEGAASALSCIGSLFGASDCKWVEPDPTTEEYGFSVDNMYHYAYGDIKDLGIAYDDKDTALRLYPLEPSHVPDYDADETHRDVANKLVANLKNQALLADADFGSLKYGAVLYQLSRRFFAGSRQPEPDLASLIRVGNDVPGWHTGYMRGSGNLSDLKLEYPHSYLGGMPYTCAAPSADWKAKAAAAIAKADQAANLAKNTWPLMGFGASNLAAVLNAQAAADMAAKAAAPYTDSCASGKPTWPAWINSTYQGLDQPPQTDDDLRLLEVARPGRSDRAGLIYLGWAVHMMQDSSLPHHVSGWTGKEHAAQDALGDLEFYYKDFSRVTVPKTTCKIPGSKLGPPQGCTTKQVPHQYAQYAKYLVDKTLATDLDTLLGPAGARKSRAQICQSLGVSEGVGSTTDLAWRSVYPLYVDNAKQTYSSRLQYEMVSGTAALDAGAVFVKNAVLGSVKLLLCGPPNPDAPVSTTFASGFVWSQSSSGSFTAEPSYSFNSSGGVSGTGVNNTITRLNTGTYQVQFPNLGNETGGNVQVTAYGGGSERCKVGSWGSEGSSLSATVLCHDTAGVLVDTLFTTSYLRNPAGSSRTGGYLWADQPTSDSYTPASTYQWNASGALNTVQRYGVGNYLATFPGVSLNGGTVEVTAYGSSSDYCKVGSWGSNTVSVLCFDNSGAPVDTMFTLNFSDSSPNGTPSFHYAWADQPSTESYTPSTFYQRGYLASECSSAGTMTMQRWAPGNYSATIPVLSPIGSNVKVTAYGGTSDTCKVRSWGGSGSGTQVDVACYDPAGQPIDTYFTIVYSTNQYIIC